MSRIPKPHHSHRDRRHRGLNARAMALLFVLMVLVLAVASVASLARISVSTRTAQDLDIDSRLCAELNRAARIAILEWLQRESGRAVLPPDAEQPRIQVLDDEWTARDGARTQSIRITAWDQLGMIPLSHLRESSPLAAKLPDPIRELAEPLADSDAPGLDLLVQGRIRRFPSAESDEPTIAALIATHNPRALRRGRSDAGAINVNTAPIPLVEAAMLLAERSGIEQIIEARSSGRLASIPGGSRDRDPIAPRLSGQSDAWSFRVDLQSGPVRRSWWCTYLYDGSRWSLAQRLLIDE